MKKIYYALIFFILLIIGFYSFVSSTYFFNRYIAKNIKEYGFNYIKVDGALFKGFVIQDLTYKSKQLSSNVELKINPFKLIYGVISVNKLHLISVRKDVLEDIVDDFKPKEDASNSIKIDLNFEFKNILLTIKPFTIDNIRIKKAALSVDKITYMDYKFNVGNLEYESKSDIANLYFRGQFKKRVLTIDSINVSNLDSEKFVKILKYLKSSDKNRDNSELLNSPFTPKLVKIKEATLNLKPFKLNELSLKDLKLKIKNAKFNVDKIVLEEGELNFNYIGKELELNLYSNYKDNNLIIYSILLNIKEPNKIEKLIKSLKLESANNSNNIVLLNRVNLIKARVTLNNYKYKDMFLKKLYMEFDNTIYNRHTKLLKSDYFNIKLDSSLGKMAIKGAVGKDIIFNNINLFSNNIDKIIKIVPKSSINSNSTAAMSIELPKNFIIDKLSIKGKQATFDPFIINSGELTGENIKGDVTNLFLKEGRLRASVISPWGVASLKGNIRDNNYYAKGSYKANQKLLDEYSLPLKAKNFNTLIVDGRFGFDSLDINILLQGKDIVKGINDLTILSSKNRLYYDYIKSDVKWDINADIKTPYTNSAKLTNTLIYINKKDNLDYYGTLILKKNIFTNLDLQKLSKNLKINYNGNYNSLNADFKSSILKGTFNTNYKLGDINISSKRTVKLSDIIKLPKEYKNIDISKLNITGKVDFNKPSLFKGNIFLNSNLTNINGKWLYNDNSFKSNFNTEFPKNSILFKNIKNLKYSAFKKFDSKLDINNKLLNLELKNNYIYSSLNYNLTTTAVKSKIKNSAIDITLNGVKNSINAKVALSSIKKALNSLYKIYNFDSKLETFDGKIDSNLKIENLDSVSFILTSPKIVSKTNGSSIKIENLYLKGKYSKDSLIINNYKFKINDYKIFSNKSSIIAIDKSNFKIKNFWINDSLTVLGNYNIESAKGKLKLKSNRFVLDSQKAKVALAVDTNINIDKNKKDITGTITVLDGKIKSTITRKNIADNEDIVILQRKKAKESTSFAKNIKLNIQIKSKKGLLYSQDGSYFKLIPTMSVKKNYNSLSDFRGTIKVSKGSYYTLNGKKLKVTKGIITFKGKSTSPNINVELKYRGREYVIYINVSGTPTRPILYFRSNPPLTKDQILAYLLFDDSSAIGTHSQDAMLNMIGGSLAKSILGSIGIRIDHISVKENGFSIGKNITKNITVYYNQDKEKPSIKTRIDITNSIHTEIELGKDKQSADIIFTQEY